MSIFFLLFGGGRNKW